MPGLEDCDDALLLHILQHLGGRSLVATSLTNSRFRALCTQARASSPSASQQSQRLEVYGRLVQGLEYGALFQQARKRAQLHHGPGAHGHSSAPTKPASQQVVEFSSFLVPGKLRALRMELRGMFMKATKNR